MQHEQVRTSQRAGDGLRAATALAFSESPDGMIRLDGAPGVVLATDTPVREYVPGVGMARVSLRMSKAMLGRWKADGILDPNGHMLMAVAHNARLDSNPALTLGRWENLRVEERDGHKALVADPAFDPASMRALMRRIGAEPDDWQGMIARGTIQRTSIWWSGTVTRSTKNQGEPPLYIADPWAGQEASWVALGADPKAGANRSHEDTTMDPDINALVAAAVAEAIPAAARQIAAELHGEAVAATTPPTATTAAPRSLDDDPSWQQLQVVAPQVLGTQALAACNAARAKGDAAAAIADLQAAIARALQERTTGGAQPPSAAPAPVPVVHRAQGGEVNAYRALTDLTTVLSARGMRDVPKGTESDRTRPGTLAHTRAQTIEAARKIDRDFETADVRTFLVDFARSMGIVEPTWYATNPREIMETLVTRWSPSGQEHIATMGGRWYGGQGAVMRNGGLDVIGTMRHGAAGSLVPADMQAAFLAVVIKVFLAVHDSQQHMLEEWGRTVSLTDLNAQTLIRNDLALGFDAVTSNQDLPEAYMFSEGVDIKTVARGVVWSYGWESMFTDGGQILAGTPALLAMRWMGAKIAHWFKRLRAGIYTPKDGAPIPVYSTYAEQGQTQADIGAWLNSVLISSGEKRPVASGALPKGLKTDVPVMGTMEPTLLLYGNRANEAVTNFYAPRALSQVNGTAQDRQRSDFEDSLQRVRTPYIEDDALFALITSGPAAAMTSVNLGGAGMSVTSLSDANIRQLPSNVVRIIDTFEAVLTHPHGAYRNKLT